MKQTDWKFEVEVADWLIADFKVLVEEYDEEKFVQKIVFQIVNNSLLEFYESMNYAKNKYKYGYQWMDKYNQLIRRWDNTPHHEYISTFPFHQHVGNEDNVQPSEPMTLSKVLEFIATNLE